MRNQPSEMPADTGGFSDAVSAGTDSVGTIASEISDSSFFVDLINMATSIYRIANAGNGTSGSSNARSICPDRDKAHLRPTSDETTQSQETGSAVPGLF